MVIFHSYVSHYQRVEIDQVQVVNQWQMMLLVFFWVPLPGFESDHHFHEGYHEI